MKKMSAWAQQHAWPARIILIAAHILLTITCIYWGTISFSNGIHLSESWLYILLLFYIGLYFFYPAYNHYFRNTYFTRLLFHSSMAVCSLLFVTVYVNVHRSSNAVNSVNASTVVVPVNDTGYKNPEAELLIKSFKAGEITKFTKKDRKVLREELKVQFKKYKEAKKTHQKKDGSDVLIIILTILGALVLLYGVAALSCSLSCNGNDAAAVIVLVVGLAAIIFGCVMIGRSLSRKNQKKRATKE